MPPKKGPPKDDKTFGMKNKNKSAKVQKYVQEVAKQQAQAGKNKQDVAKQKEAELRQKAKDAAAAKKALDAQLFGTAPQVQKVPFGTDPKTVLCTFFKAGSCSKGSKCKFSHDLNVGRKVEKVNVYEDTRKDDKKTDTMDTWDDAKLQDVVNQNAKKQTNATDIVCKFFIQAIEDSKYGWFWVCPNGGDSCMYRHALPPGFVLKKDKKKEEEKDTISLEEFIEVERHKLKAPLTPVTKESFAEWKKNRLAKKEAEAEAMEKAKVAQRAAGKMTGMTGKDLFEFGGEIFEDDEEVEEDWDISRMLARYRDEEGGVADVVNGEAQSGKQSPSGDGEEVAEATKAVAEVAI